MSGTVKIVGLAQGAENMVEVVKKISLLVDMYQAHAREYDKLIAYHAGDIKSIQMTINGKREGSGISSQFSLLLPEQARKAVMAQLIEEKRKICADLMKKIEQAKDELL